MRVVLTYSSGDTGRRHTVEIECDNIHLESAERSDGIIGHIEVLPRDSFSCAWHEGWSGVSGFPSHRALPQHYCMRCQRWFGAPGSREAEMKRFVDQEIGA